VKKTHILLKTIIAIFIAANIYSALPLISFYIKDSSQIKMRNEDVVERLKKNKDPYFSFIVFSDTGSGIFLQDAATLKVITKMNREDRFGKIPIDFALNVGDVTYRGKESHYKTYMKLKNRVKYPVIDAIGNHDDDYDNGEKGLALFRKFSGETEFSFVDRNAYFIVLDNKDGDFKEKQFAWLTGELEKGKAYKHIFIFMHKPPFNPCQQSWYRVETNPWSHEFLKLCDKYKVNIVFSGHESTCKEAQFGSVKYLVSGGGGTLLIQPSFEGGFLNYIVVKVNRDYVDYEVRRVFPPLWEFFTYYFWKDLVYFVQGIFY